MRTEDGYIIHRCLNGDSSAFGFLVDKYKAGVYAVAYERLNNFHDAEDIAQEVFLKAYRSLRNLRHWDSFASWLYRITLNLCRDWLRVEYRRPDREYTEDQDQDILDAPSRDTYHQELACESVREALDSLPENHRQILTLRYLAGMTSVEIARFAGVSPSAIRMRLSKARSLLKEEILAMMSATEQRLQSTFTLRIVDAVKRMRIQPTPRTSGFPWGLSLATGIVLAILRFSPYPGIINRAAAGSPMPLETKVLKTGEIQVDVLELSEIPVLASNPGPELPDPQAPMLTAVNSEDDISANESASEKQVITDPRTGVEYTKIMTITGKSDVIKDNLWWLSLSPNGRFLLWDKLVVPLDGGEPFDLVDMPARYGTWSPDGRKALFLTRKAIWVIPVSPETGQSTGAAKKVLDGEHEYQRCCWLPDSERIVIERRDEEASGNVCILSVIDGTTTQITNHPGLEWLPICSPDGKTIAYRQGYRLRTIPAEGGTHRELIDKGRPAPISWSPDSEWLVYVNNHNQFWKGLEFYRLGDGRQSNMIPYWRVGAFLSWSPDGEKMLFYRSSYDRKESLKVVSASNGQPFKLGGRMPDLEPYEQYWSPDSSMIVTWAKGQDGELRLWIFPLAGGEPFPLRIDALVDGKPEPFHLSPDCQNLAFVVQQDDGTEDLYVAPISLKDGRTTGSAVKVFSGWYRKSPYFCMFSWSPDGEKIVIGHKWNIWLVPVKGGEPVQITSRGSSGNGTHPKWSPDGEMISYIAFRSVKEQFLKVVPASGNEDMAILDIPASPQSYQWSPDSKDVVYFSQGVVTAISVADGKSRQLIDLRELSIDDAWGFSWSPDMKTLTFLGYRNEENSRHIFIGPAGGGKFTELAADDHSQKRSHCWSPDGKWISYGSYGYARTRPEGAIWEADVSDFLSSQKREQ